VKDQNIALLMRMPNVVMTAHQAFFTQEAMRTIADTTLKNIAGVREGSGPPKQNGKLDTLCKPMPKAAAGPPRSNMDFVPQRQVSAGPSLQAADLGPVENKASGDYKVALFSNTPYDEKWFTNMNNDLKTGLTFIFHDSRLEADTAPLAQGADVVCIFVNDDCSEKVLRLLAPMGIKMVALRCAGFNNVDLAVAKELGITVARVPAYSPHAVAEHAVALALSVNRRIPQAYAKTRAGDFTLQGLLGSDLGNSNMGRKRVGIIGTGLIGSITSRIFKMGFDCDVVAYDKFPNAKISDPQPNGLGIPYVELEELLKTSDIISLHAPLLPATKHTINMDAVKMMKKGVIIVNTSRGGLIDTKALIWGIKEGIIAEAGLDVVEGEDPYFFKDLSGEVVADDDIAYLLACNNLTITAHQAFFTMEAMKTISHTTIANINGVRNGTGPPKQKGKLDTVCLPPAK
jgi:D-lactate dehydrogenase